MREVSLENVVRIILFYTFRFIITSSFLLPFVSSSSSVNRNNYNVYNYDQTTPQFTPDGRLLQVEYASSAADLSAPLVVLEFFTPRSIRSSKSTSDTGDDDHYLEDDESLSYPCTVLITVPKQPASPQNRIIIIQQPNSDDHPDGSLGRNRNLPHRSYCVAMSGILADSLALLQAGIKVATEHSLQYQDFLSMESLVQVLADECQSRVFAGGLRPYGSTLLLCGYNDRIMDNNQLRMDGQGDEESNSEGNLRRKSFRSLIYQTDPSGGILQHHGPNNVDNERFTSKTVPSKKKQSRRPDAIVTNNVVQSQVCCIVGGSSSLQRQLLKQINQGMVRFEQRQQQRQRNRKESSISLADRIANVAKILIKETVDSNGPSHRTSNNRSKSRDYPLEVVIISPRFGCHRLEGKQLKAVQELINIDK